MEKDSLIQLLHGITIPDTEKVKAATTELQKKYYNQPVALLLLIEIALTHEDAGLRKLASVQALRLIPKHWLDLTVEQRDLARKHLLEGTLKESQESNRNSNARLISSIAHLDLEDKKEGQDMLKAILDLNTSEDISSRVLGSYIVYELVETDPTNFADELPSLLQLLTRNLHDPASKDVRLNAIKALWSLLMLIEVDEVSHKPLVKAVQQLIPPTVNMLKESVAADDETSYGPIFETLSLFLSYDSVFLAPHLSNLLHFMTEIGVNRDLSPAARVLAIDYLNQCARYRRMKLQAMKDTSAILMRTAVSIIAELDPEDEDEDDNPARTAMILVDMLAGNLPPRQVIVPLLEEFTKYASSPEPASRRAALLALGCAAEGATDFLATQVDSLIPSILSLICDQDETVRAAALRGLTDLAENLAEQLGKHHEVLVNALLQNLEASTGGATSKVNVNIIRAACAALDALGEGIDKEEMGKYGPRLIIPVGKLLSHEDLGIKASAAGAIGAIAESLGSDFKPYFQEVISALAPYVVLKDEGDALALRSAACDSMGRIATAVGAETFQPYVVDLMNASQEAMTLASDRLKETSFLLWSALARVYGEQFGPFVPQVLEALLQTLELEEKVITLPREIMEEMEGSSARVVGGKKLVFKERETDAENEGEEEEEDEEDDDDILEPITAQSLEQEAAIDTLGDVIANSCDSEALRQYVQPALNKLEPLCEHSYEGVRKNAISAIWRIYARMWNVWEKQTGQKWQRGLPPTPQPDSILIEIATLAEKMTMAAWLDDPECAVVYDINCVLANTLKACGPAILTVQESTLPDIIKNVEKILNKAHACQKDLGDDEDGHAEDLEGDTSEMDWLVIDSALEVLTGLSAALGAGFLEIWKQFEQPVLKLVSSSEDNERSTAVGIIAEIIKYSGDAITPYTRGLQTLLKRRMTDPATMAKSNAIYGMGQLILHSSDTDATIPTYQELWDLLQSLLTHEEPHLVDNVYGCLSRMMIRNPDANFVQETLPKLVAHLPMKADYDENEPVYTAILKLYQQGNSTVQQLSGNLIPVFEKVLSPPDDQLDDDARGIVKEIVRLLYEAQPSLFANAGNVVQLAGLA